MPHLRASTWSRAIVPVSFVVLPVIVGFWSYLGSAGESPKTGGTAAASAFGIPVSSEAFAEVTSALTAPEAAMGKCGEASRWSAQRNEARIKLRGCVSSEEDRLTVIGIAKAHFPDLEIDDRMQVGAVRRSGNWLGAIGFALTQLNHLKSGAVRLAGSDFTISGEARSAKDFAQSNDALQTELPAGLALAETRLEPPAAEPFVFTAELSDGVITLDGHVPSDDSRGTIAQAAAELLPGRSIADNTQLASGEPRAWDGAVKAGLRGLSLLDSGKLTISGFGVNLKGVAADPERVKTILSGVREDLPPSFKARDDISVRGSAAATTGRMGHADANPIASKIWTKLAYAAIRVIGNGPPSEDSALR